MSQSDPQNTKLRKIRYQHSPPGSRKRMSESDEDGNCVVCAHAIDIYAIGYCDHCICFRCSLKMRILRSEKFCPVCRKDLKKVLFSKHKSTFSELNKLKLIKENRHNVNIFFEDPTIIKEFNKVMEHKCPVCKDRPPDHNFEQTKVHLRKEHSLFYCEMCLEHIKNFTSEYKAYNRKDLATHKRIGDAEIADDTSHRGHPLCKFCDERYFDNDHLFLHLRKDHYYCHICDRTDSNDFYADYNALYGHFKADHFVCVLDNCANEQFTNVFASELDLKAHTASAHKSNKSKQQQKQDRQIDLGFRYAKREPQLRGRGRGGLHENSSRRNKQSKEDNASAFERDGDLQKAIALSMEDVKASTSCKVDAPKQKAIVRDPIKKDAALFNDSDDFPSLNHESIEESRHISKETVNPAVSLWTVGQIKSRNALNDDFPSLSTQSDCGGSQLKASSWSVKKKSLKSHYDEFPCLSRGPVSSSPSPWLKVEKSCSKSKQKLSKDATRASRTHLPESKPQQLKASDFLKADSASGSIKPPCDTRNAQKEDDFPALIPINSVLVGRGSHKHVEAHSSFAGEAQSKVKMIPTSVLAEKHQHEPVNNHRKINLIADYDFPSLNPSKNVAAPPGFEKVRPATSKAVQSWGSRQKSKASSDVTDNSGQSNAGNFQRSSIAEPLKSSTTTNGELKLPKEKPFSVVGADFPSLPKNKNKFHVKPDIHQKAQPDESKSGRFAENSDVDLTELVSERAPGFRVEANDAVFRKDFKSHNLDQDFPALELTHVPAHKSSRTSVKAQPCRPAAPATRMELNLASVFDDTPSL